MVSGRIFLAAVATSLVVGFFSHHWLYPHDQPIELTCDQADVHPSVWTRDTSVEYPAWRVECSGYSKPGTLIILD